MLQQPEATHGPPSLTPPQGALTALCSAAWQGVDAAVLAQRHTLKMADFLKVLTGLKFDICAALLCFRTYVCTEHGLPPPQGAVLPPE